MALFGRKTTSTPSLVSSAQGLTRIANLKEQMGSLAEETIAVAQAEIRQSDAAIISLQETIEYERRDIAVAAANLADADRILSLLRVDTSDTLGDNGATYEGETIADITGEEGEHIVPGASE